MKIETTFQLSARLITVPAIVAGPGRRSQCRLVLDTAAVYTTLTPDVVERLGLSHEHALRSTVIRSAVGDERGYLVNLDQVTTLGVVFRNVEAIVANLGYGIDGLIGMNVLGQLNFEVRSGERRAERTVALRRGANVAPNTERRPVRRSAALTGSNT